MRKYNPKQHKYKRGSIIVKYLKTKFIRENLKRHICYMGAKVKIIISSHQKQCKQAQMPWTNIFKVIDSGTKAVNLAFLHSSIFFFLKMKIKTLSDKQKLREFVSVGFPGGSDGK